MAGADRISGELREAMRALGYDERWLRYGFITPEIILRQHRDYLTGDPYCEGTEHLRLRAFGAWRLYRVHLTDEEVGQFLELAAADPDRAMANSELIRLVSDPNLTEAQFMRAAEEAVRSGVPIERVERERFARRRERGEIGDADLRQAIEAKDGVLHEMLLGSQHLPRWALERLAEEGANKGIRNRAAQLLRSGRGRAP